VPCLPHLSRSRRGTLALGTLLVSSSCATVAARLERPAAYRAPAIVLAYPEAGAALPADKAVVLFRFVPREADDPVDAASFRATVDGADRTALFRATSQEAWGTLAEAATPAASGTPAATPGPHTVAARVCSARGACGALTAVVDVRAWEQALKPAATRQ